VGIDGKRGGTRGKNDCFDGFATSSHGIRL
jgi:hypothetical protein